MDVWRLPKPSEMRKALVALLSFVATAVAIALASGDLVPVEYARWAIFLTALANVYGVYKIPNDRAPGTPRAEAENLSVRETDG